MARSRLSPEREVIESALILVRRYGADARAYAQNQVERYTAEHDANPQLITTWTPILRAILECERRERTEEEVVQ